VANQGGGGRTPLMEAAGGGHKDIVAAIRSSNATIDLTDDFGNTALHYAAYHGRLTVVHELLKGDPRRDIKNSYGHTAASYASSNQYKAIADLLNRVPSRRAKVVQVRNEKDKEYDSLFDDLATFASKQDRKLLKEELHVKGHAEDLHKKDKLDFAPKIGTIGTGISESERKSLEDEISRLKRQHDETELRNQKRIMELLEKSSEQQKMIDNAEREVRNAHLNMTELQLRIKEFESRHQSNELRIMDERQRADRYQEDLQRSTLEAERHKSRAEGAEQERDLHMDASRRHEESLRRKQDEVSEHLSRTERQSREVSELRDDLRRREDELGQLKEQIAVLQRQAGVPGGGLASGDSAPTQPAAWTTAKPAETLHDLPTGAEQTSAPLVGAVASDASGGGASPTESGVA